MLFADVILPLPLDSLFTYSIPDEYGNIQTGQRVIVQFGKKKYYTAIVVRVYNQEEPKDNIKEIVSVLDNYPMVSLSQLEFWNWISFYYMCSLGEVYKAAFPAVLKLESETFISSNIDFEADKQLTLTEQKIFDILTANNQALKISEIENQLKISNVIYHIKSLVDKGAVCVSENIKNTYSAKTEKMICLAKNFSDKELHLYLDILSRAKKQQHLLSVFLDLKSESGSGEKFSVSKKSLLEKAQVSPSIVDGLVERNILKQIDFEISRFDYGQTSLESSNSLNIYQEKAYDEITTSFAEQSVVLLHGITSSGKTEIYIQLIKDTIAQGKQVLYLLPEIALTTQITERLKLVFGNKLSVYHSKFNDNERAETWMNLLTNAEGRVVLGARSAIFLPFSNLGLIIVDEEHESSYKQQDPAPRYNARNAAIVLAGIHNTKVLLGTATPAIETYHNALSGKFGLVSLNKRHDNIELPHIISINTKELRRKKQMKSILSPPLIEEMRNTFSRNEQVILFQNRRGFAPLLECKVCSWTPRCNNCDVSLTYHKGQSLMVCHYCGAAYPIPPICPNCETPTLDMLGYGTERIEEEVAEQFPDASIARMDLDTTRTKKAYENMISDFELGKTNVLIGTQMISKGLDFDDVSIVGIINADSLLNYPDFRAHEKAYQLMTQVSGRSGRKNKQGLVLLQTSQPEHPIISCVVNNDYQTFYEMQIAERQLFGYPPFLRLITIVMKGKDEQLLDEASRRFAQSLRTSFSQRVLGPTKPSVSRIQTFYIRTILLKIENQASPQKVREAIRFHQQQILLQPEFRSVLMYFDVDPLT